MLASCLTKPTVCVIFVSSSPGMWEDALALYPICHNHCAMRPFFFLSRNVPAPLTLSPRRLTILLSAVLSLGLLLPFPPLEAKVLPKADSRGHRLSQWKEFYKLSRRDRPRECLELLPKMKEEAKKEGLLKDFYDAGREEFRLRALLEPVRRKEFESKWGEELHSMGEPVLVYRFLRDSGNNEDGRTGVELSLDYALSNREGLSSSHHPELVGNVRPDDLFRPGDDYAHILWNSRFSFGDKVLPALREHVRGSAFQELCLDRYIVGRKPLLKRVDELRTLREKYSSIPEVHLLSRDILVDSFTLLCQDPLATERKALALQGEAKAHERAIASLDKSLRGQCTVKSSVLEPLEKKTYKAYVKDGKIILQGRNIPSPTIKIGHHTIHFRNAHRKFFVNDTLYAPLPPDLDDGYWPITESPSLKYLGSYTKHTLSADCIEIQRGGFLSARVAHFVSGEPVKEADIVVSVTRENGSSVEKYRGRMALSPTFSVLPAGAQRLLAPKASRFPREWRKVRFEWKDSEGKLHSTPDISVLRHTPDRRNAKEKDHSRDLHARVLRSAGAYRPADTLRAVVIVYEGDPSKSLRTPAPGRTVTVRLNDPSGKLLHSETLSLNEWGSATFSYHTPQDILRGECTLEVLSRSRQLLTEKVRIGDFTLPTYEVTLDNPDSLYRNGEDITIHGKIRSFSSHPITDARIEAMLDGTAFSGVPSPDGTFSLQVHTPSKGWRASLLLTVTDPEGESVTLDRTLTLGGSVDLSCELLNYVDEAAVDVRDFGAGRIKLLPSGKNPSFRISVRNPDSQILPWKVKWQLLGSDSSVIKTGEATSGESFEVDMASLPDGLYSLRSTVHGDRSTKSAYVPFLRKSSETLPAGVRSLIVPGKTDLGRGEDITFTVSGSDGTVWAAASLFSVEGTLLESIPLKVEGNGKSRQYSIPFKAEYSETVLLDIRYFRDGKKSVFTSTFHQDRSEATALPLRVESMGSSFSPSTRYSITLGTVPGVEAAVSVVDRSLDAVAPHPWSALSLLSPSVVFPKVWTVCGTDEARKPSAGSVLAMPGVYGIVRDEEGPIVGASITANGKGTMTDIEGKFSLDVPPGTLLRIECIGYVGTLLPAEPDMDIMLSEDLMALDETAVIAYGVSGKNTITGVLQTAASGLRVRGASSERASEDPLYIVDGVITTKEKALTLLMDPSITMKVLSPDQSRGIYGSRAAGGADIISTGEGLQEEDYSERGVREVFSEVLLFEPQLRSDSDGKITFSFRTSDKLSSYHLKVFAHDRKMANSSLAEDILVTIPVKVSLREPRFLYKGDRGVLACTLSSISDTDTEGRMVLLSMDSEGKELSRAQTPIRVSQGETRTVDIPFGVSPDCKDDTLTFKLLFVGDRFSDGVSHQVPLYDSFQTITRTASALLLHPSDEAGAVDSLRRTVAIVPLENEPTVQSESVRDMLLRSWDELCSPKDSDLVTLSSAYYCLAVKEKLDGNTSDSTASSRTTADKELLLKRILSSRNPDGGFPWRAGMRSSSIVTAALLERFAMLRDRGEAIPQVDSSVMYLDKVQFEHPWGLFFNDLSAEQYMAVRSMWAEVPFISVKDADKGALRSFRSFARKYLTPGRYDYENKDVLGRARRCATLSRLIQSEEGLALARSWGELLLVGDRFTSTIRNDIEVLGEYAVPSAAGGRYYPSAVKFFRGLLSSEVYAHVLISSLVENDLRDDILLWLLIQKQTQSWENDPYFAEALSMLWNLPDELLGSRIVTLSSSSTLPFEKVTPASSGMTVERSFQRMEPGGRWKTIPEGEVLHVGDRIRACYTLTSQQNRSFVKLTAPHESSLSPVDELSGIYNLALRPIHVNEVWQILPSGYREVSKERTVYSFDVLAEGESEVTEEFTVNREGAFRCPTCSVTCLYSPGWSASDGWKGERVSEK